MSGGKSSSSSSSTSTSVQETITPDISGVVAGDAIQGQTITISGLAGSDLGAAISALINVVGDTVQGAGELATNAIQAQRDTSQSVAAPTQNTIEKLTPIITILGGLAAVVAIVQFFRGK